MSLVLPPCQILIFSFLNWQTTASSLRALWFLLFQTTKAMKWGTRSWPLRCRRHCGIGLMLIASSYLAKQIYLCISHFHFIYKGLACCRRLYVIPTTSHAFLASPGFLCFVSKQLFSEWRSCYYRSCYSSPRCILLGSGIWVIQLFILLFKMTKYKKFEEISLAELKYNS